MKTSTLIVLSACALLLAPPSADADFLEVDLGSFRNTYPVPTMEYEGDFAQHVWTDTVDYLYPRTRYNIDIGAIMQEVHADSLVSITIIDTGVNQYYGSPGADVDLLDFTGLPHGTQFTAEYVGPNQHHQGESSQTLMERVALMDSTSGSSPGGINHVALGYLGRLMVGFTLPPDDVTDPGDDGGIDSTMVMASTDLLLLHLGEAGYSEQFQVIATFSMVPSPGVMGILAIAGTVLRRRSRRL